MMAEDKVTKSVATKYEEHIAMGSMGGSPDVYTNHPPSYEDTMEDGFTATSDDSHLLLRTDGTRKGYGGINSIVLPIIATICCCWPCGAIAIYYTHKASTEAAYGNTMKAQELSKRAKKFLLASIVLGIIFITTVIIIEATVVSTYVQKKH